MDQRQITVAFVLTIALALSFPVQIGAQEPEQATESPEAMEQTRPGIRPWNLKASLVLVDADGGVSTTGDPSGVSTSVSAGGGISFRLERTLTPRLGLEFGLTTVASGIDISAGWGKCDHNASVDMLSVVPLTLGLNVHLTPNSPVDVYVGPMLAYVTYSDLRIHSGWDCEDQGPWWDWGWSSTVKVGTDRDLTWGLNAGIEFPFGKSGRWSGHVGVTYIESSYELERFDEEDRFTNIKMDPVMLNLGFGFRFGAPVPSS
ncbi:MAG: outer membrane beta-barrel protein [bacterium]|nr:outer membrane beta-barrel protein [bacterium]